nr:MULTISPECIES: hypothetical protein [unclassified Burkholderia]
MPEESEYSDREAPRRAESATRANRSGTFRIDVAERDERPFYRTFGAMLTLRAAIRFTSPESAQECRIDADNAHVTRDHAINSAMPARPGMAPSPRCVALRHASSMRTRLRARSRSS